MVKVAGDTHTWFSPLGDRNHAATHMAAMMNRPMKMLHLEEQRQRMQVLLPHLVPMPGDRSSLPVSHFEESGGLSRGMMGASSIVTGWTMMMLSCLLLAWLPVGAPLT